MRERDEPVLPRFAGSIERVLGWQCSAFSDSHRSFLKSPWRGTANEEPQKSRVDDGRLCM